MSQKKEKLRIIDAENWSNIFPVVSTVFDSISFVERFITVAISTILYLRKILPESEFEEKVLDRMTLKMLKKETENSDSQRVKTWLSGAFEALRKKFLKSISLEITDIRNNMTLEVYAFNISYDPENNISLNVSKLSGDNKGTIFEDGFISYFQFQTLRLLQMCYTVAESSQELQGEFAVLMKLSYQENTSVNYQPSGYKDYAAKIPIFPNKTRNLKFGTTNTGYHFINFVTKSCLLDESIFPKRGEGESMNKTIDFSSQQSSSPKVSKPMCSTGLGIPSSLLRRDVKIFQENTQNSSQCTDDASQSELVRCPCLSQIKTSLMYQCSGCRFWVHAECFGINLADKLVKIDMFYCQLCHKLNKDYVCCDKLMVKLDDAFDQQKLAVKRRLLGFCSRMDKQEIGFRKFEKASGLSYQKEFVDSILKNMIKEGVLYELSRGIYSVNRSSLKQKMVHYFLVESSFQGNAAKRNVKKGVGYFTPKLKQRKVKDKGTKKEILKTQRPQLARGIRSLS